MSEYLNELADFCENKILLKDLKYIFDQKAYMYGNNFCDNHDKKKSKLKFYIVTLIFFVKRIFLKKNKKNKKNIIISSAYFNILETQSFNDTKFIQPPWKSVYFSFNLWFYLNNFSYILRNTKYEDIISIKNLQKFTKYISLLEQKIIKNKPVALIVPQDQGLFEKLSIRIFAKIEKPSFLFLHGLPGRYNIIDENTTDFLVVWGNKIKENYINCGFDPDKILISGHPKYKNYNIEDIVIDSSLDSIVVLTKSDIGAPSSCEYFATERINILTYLWMIKNVLLKFGIKTVKLRLHPSENKKWYNANIDTFFFKIDNNKLEDTLKQASCVIGPTSTVFLESLLNGVNYFVFEPTISTTDILKQKLVPPFDGTDKRIVISKNKNDLERNLENNTIVNKQILLDYIKPNYDISFIKKIIDEYKK